MADLGKKDGRGKMCHGVTETKDETATDVHSVSVGEGTQDGTDNHENASDHNWDTTTISISQEWTAKLLVQFNVNDEDSTHTGGKPAILPIW
jgi:hypothetical protein